VLEKFVKLDPACVRAFGKLQGREKCFGWEERLVGLTQKNAKQDAKLRKILREITQYEVII